MIKRVIAILLSICVLLLGAAGVQAETDAVQLQIDGAVTDAQTQESPDGDLSESARDEAFIIEAQSPGTPAATVSDTTGNETRFEIRLSEYTPSAASDLSVAVWSAEGGKDDLRWYAFDKSGDDYVANVSVSDHKTAGIYYADIYDSNGGMSFVTGTDFTVSGISAASVKPDKFDNAAGTCSIVVEGISSLSGISQVMVPTWCADDQSDIVWYAANADGSGNYTVQINTANHKYHTGVYKSHVYVTAGNGIFAFVGGTTVTFENKNAMVVPTVSQSECRIDVTGIEVPGGLKKVAYAVWSDAGGQDDLIWMTADYAKTSHSSSLSYALSSFKTFGLYFADVYGVNQSGQYVWLGGTTYTVKVPAATDMTFTNNNAEGTFEIKVSGVTCDSGVKSVMIPVWSRADYSDICWYTASKNAEGDYVVKSDISKHKYNTGTYYADAYVVDSNGFTGFVIGKTRDFVQIDGLVKVTPTDTDYQVDVTGFEVPGGLKAVCYAVWSATGGQDDLKWFMSGYDNKTKSAREVYAASKFSTFGLYYVDVYGVRNDGQYVWMGEATYTINPPSATGMTVTYNNAAGTFEIKVSGVTCDSPIKAIMIPVWSRADQSDICWYMAEKNSAGDYVVKSDISKHKYSVGKYYADAYVVDTKGYTGFVCGDTMTFEIKYDSISVGAGSDEKLYPVTVKNLEVPGGAKAVVFPAWSKARGQDDVIWYKDTSNGKDHTVTVDIANHKTAGDYFVDVYAQTKNGDLVYVTGTTDLNVNPTVNGTISISNVNGPAGQFAVTVTINSSSSGIQFVQIPVWTAADQNDICWYNTTRSGNSFTAVVDVKHHKYNFGDFKIHAYATFNNGIKEYVNATSYTFKPANYMYVVKTGSGKRDIYLKNVPGSATAVKFPVWSNTGGQDDIVWNDATNLGGGTWKATIDVSRYKHDGTFTAHAYVYTGGSGATVAGRMFDVDKSEMKKNGWFYETFEGHTYKFYYINDVRQTDVRGIIGAQGSYRATVNRTCNTVTIFAADGSNGYIIPVCAFACSVGLPGTPTDTGTFYTSGKWRWKELMGPSYGQYATRIYTSVYFHSVAGKNTTPYNLNYIDYNNLGQAASHGCVRLNVRDAKWIYDNCQIGMQVTIYDSGNPGPMGKPATIKIPAGQTWDPTDPAV